MADWWENKDTWLEEIITQYDNAAFYVDQAFTKIGIAESEWWIPDDHSALGWVIYCLFDLIEAVADLCIHDDDVPRDHYFPEWIQLYGQVKWQSIVAAWQSNQFEGRQWTIATIDEMRRRVWDEEFDVIFATETVVQEEPP